MLRRSPAALKMDIQLKNSELEAYLRRIAWPGSFEALTHFWRGDDLLGGEAKFQLACGDGLHPLIEFEFDIFSDSRSLVKAEKLVNFLQARGLCDKGRGQALLAWPGETRLRMVADGSEIRTQRWLDLKLCWHAGSGWSAKAYLGFSPRFSVPVT